ncbi:hypothetical protein JZ785_21520 [Alicyclobacillus curvatus]|nr:hypothetical protein JZ785_21520 [Alicyclobacillus curvatus]
MSLKTKLAMAMATSAAGAAMIAGGTFALFTASTTNGPNTFTAGTVKVTDYTGGSAFKSAQYVANLAPGDKENGYITIKNEGSLGAWVAIKDVQVNTSHGEQLMSAMFRGDTGPNPNPDEDNDGGSHDNRPGGGDTNHAATLFDGKTPLQITYDNGQSKPIYIPAGQSKTFVVHYEMPLQAGNEYQGLSGTATFDFEAVQQRNNTNANSTGPLSWQ